jgi:hypothetical protein
VSDAHDDEYDDELIPLAIELMTAATCDEGDGTDFVLHAAMVLDDPSMTQEKVNRLVLILASFASGAISQWAVDTDRSPGEVLRCIALEAATAEAAS